MDCCKTLKPFEEGGEERKGDVEEYTWGQIRGGGKKKKRRGFFFFDGEVCPNSNNSFKEAITFTEASKAGRTVHVCMLV